ncbi:hypothetical protein DSUL_60289 [Desulfovibrionales bacterium]
MPSPEDLILLVSSKGKQFLFRLDQDRALHTHEGRIPAKTILETCFDGIISSHLGKPYRLLRPTIYDCIKGLHRETKILYPKKIGYILLKLGIGPGSRVIRGRLRLR